MTHSALVDTGGFYALISENDVNHERALGVFRKANAERWALVTTNVVVFETYALLVEAVRPERSIDGRFVVRCARPTR